MSHFYIISVNSLASPQASITNIGLSLNFLRAMSANINVVNENLSILLISANLPSNAMRLKKLNQHYYYGSHAA